MNFLVTEFRQELTISKRIKPEYYKADHLNTFLLLPFLNMIKLESWK